MSAPPIRLKTTEEISKELRGTPKKSPNSGITYKKRSSAETLSTFSKPTKTTANKTSENNLLGGKSAVMGSGAKKDVKGNISAVKKSKIVSLGSFN